MKFQGVRSSPQELEKGTPQGGNLSLFHFHLLIEQLAALPFHEDTTVLLSYADDLALVVIGRGIKLRRTQQALELISESARSWGSRSRPRSPGP